MILEQLPEVRKLPASVKRQLAEELLRDADGLDEIEVDVAVMEVLEARLAEYARNPAAVTPWRELSHRVFGGDEH